MSTSTSDVVVTGLGATTPLGGDVPSTWAAALAGESGARTLENDWAERYEIPVTFAATIKVDPAEVLARPEIKRMDPSTQYAIIAARFGPTATGYYQRAYLLGVQYQTKVSQILVQFLVAIFSRASSSGWTRTTSTSS